MTICYEIPPWAWNLVLVPLSSALIVNGLFLVVWLFWRRIAR